MKIKFCYKTFHLGTLTFENGLFVYNSILKNEMEAKESSIKMQFYNLTNSVNKTSNVIFDEFEEFLTATNRQDIVKKAKIKENDSPFVKLYKFSKLNINQDDFYITN